jgi:hypothetical protein
VRELERLEDLHVERLRERLAGHFLDDLAEQDEVRVGVLEPLARCEARGRPRPALGSWSGRAASQRGDDDGRPRYPGKREDGWHAHV